MTQKELLYLEDAIGHEESIIKIGEDAIKNLTDENLIAFMKNEVDSHIALKEKFLNMLEEKANG